jgi:hypothetical protein
MPISWQYLKHCYYYRYDEEQYHNNVGIMTSKVSFVTNHSRYYDHRGCCCNGAKANKYSDIF